MSGFILTLFISSAFFAAIDQIIRLERISHSWLPSFFWYWVVSRPTIDAWHTYQGLKIVLFGLFFYFFQMNILWFAFINFEWFWLSIVIYIWYQIRNLFLHVVLLKPKYWQFPFFRFLFS